MYFLSAFFQGYNYVCTCIGIEKQSKEESIGNHGQNERLYTDLMKALQTLVCLASQTDWDPSEEYRLYSQYPSVPCYVRASSNKVNRNYVCLNFLPDFPQNNLNLCLFPLTFPIFIKNAIAKQFFAFLQEAKNYICLDRSTLLLIKNSTNYLIPQDLCMSHCELLRFLRLCTIRSF